MGVGVGVGVRMGRSGIQFVYTSCQLRCQTKRQEGKEQLELAGSLNRFVVNASDSTLGSPAAPRRERCSSVAEQALAVQRVIRSTPRGGPNSRSVVRAFAHGAMGRRIDPSWGGPIELILVSASASRSVLQRPWYVLSNLVCGMVLGGGER